MNKVPRNGRADPLQQTREAYGLACTALGYAEPTREAEEVIEFLGLTADGKRGGHLAGFYPDAITESVDRAARLARAHPEALLSDAERALLDLVLKATTS